MGKVFAMTETEKRFINNDLWKIFYIQLDRDYSGSVVKTKI